MKTFQVRAHGDSMFPILQDKDVVEYIKIPFHTIKVNDIVLVYSKGILITHRVLYKTKYECITRGDNNITADITIQKEKIFAKVVRFKRSGTWYDIQDIYITQSALYLQEIKNLESALRLKKISHVFLKGVLISLRYENSIPKRIYADCDVLVERNDQVKITEALKTLGYELQTTSFIHKKNTMKSPEASYVKMINGVPVVFDVHFEPVFLMTQLSGMNLLYPSKLLTQLGKYILDRSEIKKIKGSNYSICSISDQILYLALHIFHHNFTDIVRYRLLDAVIRKGSLTNYTSRNNMWVDLANTIKIFHLEGYCYGVFLFLKKYFKTPIPQSFFIAIHPKRYMLLIINFMYPRVDVFSQNNRTVAGITRFILIFFLSPEPLWKKIMIMIYFDTVKWYILILSKKIKQLFK
jgi:signal peptidase I